MSSIDLNLNIRIERAKSWFDLATKPDTPKHGRFIFYWISFNALYGLTPIDPDNLEKERPSQLEEIRPFLARIKSMAKFDDQNGKRILQTFVKKCRKDIEELIGDHFLSPKYWKGKKSPSQVVKQCQDDWDVVKEELGIRGYDSLLLITCQRLIVLRNQILHGSAMANSKSKGYQSLQRGLRILESLVPTFISLLESYGQRIGKWPKAPYPRHKHPEHPHF